MLMFVFALGACRQGKVTRMQQVQDSITRVALQRDSAILNFVASMNEIQTNLDSIKRIQAVVQMETEQGGELQREGKDRIISDIRLINALLEQNKELVARLKNRLGSSEMKVAQLQQAMLNLSRQVEEKDAEIALLEQEVSKLYADMDELTDQLEAAEEKTVSQELEIQEKTRTLEKQTIEMNTAWYAFGTEKELTGSGLIEKEGGFLGLGRTLKLREDFDPVFFTKVDMRDLQRIPLYVEKATLVTPHPEGSWHFAREGEEIESLEIDNTREFWKNSRYLVIVVK